MLNVSEYGGHRPLRLKYASEFKMCIGPEYTPLAVVSRARNSTRINHCYTIAQIPAVLSKEGAVIGAVLSTRKFHRGHP
jgi:hypothetical protein